MKDKRELLIQEAATKEIGDPAWRDRLEQWIEINKPRPRLSDLYYKAFKALLE